MKCLESIIWDGSIQLVIDNIEPVSPRLSGSRKTELLKHFHLVGAIRNGPPSRSQQSEGNAQQLKDWPEPLLTSENRDTTSYAPIFIRPRICRAAQ